MATLAEARERIYGDFLTAWGVTSEVTLDGEDFKPPAGDVWVRVAIRHTARSQESLGAPGRRKFEAVGSVIVQCFMPLDNGRTAADTLAATAQAVFEGKHLLPEGIRFTSSAITEVGPTEDWYQINVEAFFTYTETK